ncbi:MAG: tyrosine--tRNA ligase [Candidatus Shikimatogenerans bostrichidophilus]|nr:MAG: tyrosine--tRNA ligase [Candidatus Shikimatogenerans bostrichidophilus]
MNNLIKELENRNLIINKTKNLNKILKEKRINLYIGFDPSFISLHIGHLIPLFIIKIISNYFKKIKKKNKIFILIGNYTVKIGDIKNNNIKKKKKKNKEIFKNKKYIINQIKKILNNSNIKIINNKKWLKKIKLINFLNKICNKISINLMLKKKIINDKLKNKECIYLSEFIYQILQAYDFFYLNKKKKIILQIGGSDQWTNITTGIKLIKKKKIYGFTFPLLLDKEGKKFSKSSIINKNIWLSKKYTSIFNFYQYFINLSDNDSLIYIKYFFNFKKKKKNKNKYFQKIIAKKLTCWIHGKKNYYNILFITKLLFKKKKIKKIKKNFFLIKKYIKNINFYIKKKKNIYIYDLIKIKKIFKSNNEYKKYIKNKGIFLVNNKNIYNNLITNFKNLIKNKYLLIQKGKKKFFILKIIKNKNE